MSDPRDDTQRPPSEGAARGGAAQPPAEGAARGGAAERPVTEAGPHTAPHKERPPAAGGAAQQAAGPKPKPPYTAHPPKPAGVPRSETAFSDADVPPAREPGEPAEAVPEAGSREAEYLDLAQRTRAELENFRKRAARDAAAAADRGMARLAKELLPAFDHLELALQHAGEESELAKGIRLVQDEIRNALGRVGIQAFEPKGEAFDPNEHEAVAQIPVEGADSGTVTEVYQSGYRLNGTILRPARVVVAQ